MRACSVNWLHCLAASDFMNLSLSMVPNDIERVFEDGKSHCGMTDYQLRNWVGWHHHFLYPEMTHL